LSSLKSWIFAKDVKKVRSNFYPSHVFPGYSYPVNCIPSDVISVFRIFEAAKKVCAKDQKLSVFLSIIILNTCSHTQTISHCYPYFFLRSSEHMFYIG
jgi:hypothetical protein